MKLKKERLNKLNQMVKLMLLLFFSGITLHQSLACDPVDYNFCQFASESKDSDMELFSCKIIETSSNKVEMKVLTDLIGFSSREQITVWDDEGFECNGFVSGTKVAQYGQQGDTIICFLNGINRNNLQNEDEKPGDFRAATFISHTTFIKVENGKLNVNNIDSKEVKYTYKEFLRLMNSGDCIQYSNTCDIDNPLNLPWLANKITNSVGRNVYNISQFKHKGETHFAISDELTFGCMRTIYDDAIDPLPTTTSYYNCSGDLVCIDDCKEDFLNDYHKHGKLIWNYCKYVCNYETKGIVKDKDPKGCGFFIETEQGDQFLVEDIYTDFSFKTGQQIEFSFINKFYVEEFCADGNNIDINCIREIETKENCKVPESKIISNPVICGRGTLNLETDFDIDNNDFTYIFIKVNNADDSFEILNNTSVADDSACYYGVAYKQACDIPDFNANKFSEILSANADYTITDCFEIERAVAPGYSISTEPYCISEDLFTVGITITGASGKYIIGEDYTGNEVEGVEGENLITLKTGQEFYNFRPKDALTGCANDFGLAVKDPGCGCICPFVVAPVCGVDGETYGNDCLAFCAGVEVDYTGDCAILPKIFTTYEWLNNYINPNSCEPGIQIDVYKAGSYHFVHIQYATGIDLMHFENGEVICKTYDRASCLNFFNFGEPVDSWQCGDLINPDPHFFENYTWLNPIVNENNCEGTTIKQYEKSEHKYILVETEAICNLYYQNGYLFCTDEDASVCIKKYNLKQPTKVWTCDNGNKTSISPIDKQFNIFPNPSQGEFKVELMETKASYKKINVLDMYGKIIQTSEVSPNQKTVSVNISNVAGGVYWIQLSSPSGSSTKKIIIH